ncbi:cell division protein FtsQ/DivIB [Wenyingzhuangia sp. IMCC45533]
MKKYFVYIKTVLFLTLILLVLSFTSRRNEARLITDHVKVFFSNEDNLFLTHKMVDNLLIQNGKHVTNQPKSLIHLPELEKKVQEHPMVSVSEVSVGVLGDIQVNIKQRKPIARMFTTYDIVYLDKQGKEMPLSNHFSARVPIVDNTNNYIKTGEIYPLMLAIYKDEFLRKTVVYVKKDKEGYWLQTRVNKQRVLLGDLNRTQAKLKNLKVFYSYMEKDSLSSTFKKIDLQYNNQVVCSK